MTDIGVVVAFTGLIESVPAITSATAAATSFLINMWRASKQRAPRCGGSVKTLQQRT
jgi:hypothetical protein